MHPGAGVPPSIQQQQQQQQANPNAQSSRNDQGGVGGMQPGTSGGPGGQSQGIPPPGMVAPPHPSAARLNDLLEFVKAEFEQVAGEGGVLRAQREEYEAMSESESFLFSLSLSFGDLARSVVENLRD